MFCRSSNPQFGTIFPFCDFAFWRVIPHDMGMTTLVAIDPSIHRAGFESPAPVNSAAALGLLLVMALMTGLALMAVAIVLPFALLVTWAAERLAGRDGDTQKRRPGWQAVTA